MYTQVLDLNSFLKALLSATVETDFAAAMHFVKLIREFGFETPDPGTPPTPNSDLAFGRMRMLSFTCARPSLHPDGERFETRIIRVPLLSLVPLPMLQINHADFDFNLNIHGTEGEPIAPPRLSKSDGVPEEQHPRSIPRLRVALTDNVTEASTAQLHVRIGVKPADMPAGVATLLNIARETVQASSVQGSLDLGAG